MYQHDVNQTRLAETLANVGESVVNQVGVDLNTASIALLRHVAGIGPKLAEKIVAYRDAHGRFRTRRELMDVPGLGPKAFEQAAGFLRILDGKNPLDKSAIHPESYHIAEAIITRSDLSLDASFTERNKALADFQNRPRMEQLAGSLGIGLPTLEDILDQLVQPGRDPREDLPGPILRSDVLAMEDLKPGMELNGTVTNVVDFGAFVDIGVKQDGLLHRSKIPTGAKLHVGEIIKVVILTVDSTRGRISLGWSAGGGRLSPPV